MDGPSPPADLNVRLTSDNLSIRSALGEVIAALKARRVDPDALGSVEIVLAEALNNVAEHAYAMRGDGLIEINGHVMPGQLQFDIVDEGAPMPMGDAPEGCAANLDVPLGDMPEGGFGWFLIRQMTEDLTYLRSNGRNHLSLTLAVI
ncbi:ATP-binding protein [Pseudaestuariivita atlantica]|uniref:Histidine kinase/HSP90-like ATPase domain-containing protein n=1 Tax=Pseudaestuariivita atlantica TaxID=1317121 RepID=A0A0L1JQ27_9RHOB|nr:ATP-binding protein [Pseudaestuariivita atlantica]KNG93488.1 hypothetical protein ATO11_09680 [Pseudaestuariivita atlantica]